MEKEEKKVSVACTVPNVVEPPKPMYPTASYYNRLYEWWYTSPEAESVKE